MMLLVPMILAAAAVAPPPDDATLYARLRDAVAASYDTAQGGWVATRHGIPSEAAVELGLHLGEGDPAGPWTQRSLRTIAWTYEALFDSVGGGYYNHNRDAVMDHARFDKRTDSNARRLENHLLAWRMTGDEAHRKDATRVRDYCERVLLDGRGGFVAGQIGDPVLQPEANGLAIHAWLNYAAATQDVRYRDFAAKSLDRVWEVSWMDTVGLIRRGVFGEILAVPQLIDQAEMGRAFVLASYLIGRPQDRERAVEIGERLLANYTDEEKGGFRTEATKNKKGGFKKASRDFVENARTARYLCELSTLTGDAKYRQAATRAWGSFPKEFEKLDEGAPEWALALRAALEPEVPTAPEWAKAKVASEETPKKSFRIKYRR